MAHANQHGPSEAPLLTAPSPKRPRGRPRTATLLVKRAHRGRPRKDAIPPAILRLPDPPPDDWPFEPPTLDEGSHAITVSAPGPVAASVTAFAKIRDDDASLTGIIQALRLQGLSQSKIALGLSIHRDRVRRILRNARAAGTLNDTLLDLTHEALPLATERLIEKLDQGKRWAIEATLNGLGGFRTYRQQETVIDQHKSLEVTFIRGPRPITIDAQAIVGRPRDTREDADATLHARRLEGAEPETLRSGRSGEIVGVGGEGQNPRRELEDAAREDAQGPADDPLAAACRP